VRRVVEQIAATATMGANGGRGGGGRSAGLDSLCARPDRVSPPRGAR
jgi:hypothetical protein